jgi:hypothetical protein
MPEWLKPSDLYRAVALPPVGTTTGSGWPRCSVSVQRRDYSTGAEYDRPLLPDDPDVRWDEVYRYDRNYSFGKTFEPFRQLRDGVWRDYALISRDYTYLEVLDIAAGEVVATEQPEEKLIQSARELIEKHPDRYKDAVPEELARTWGFCPTGFMVPDWWEAHDGSILPDSEYWNASYENLTGEWGVYEGTVWGDDWAYKLRYVDLSRVSEGVVTADDRFGYVPIPHNLEVRAAVNYSCEGDAITVSVPIRFDRVTGAGKRCMLDDLNLT